MSDRTALNAVKDVLQNNLTDPIAQYDTDTSRSWVHTDQPLIRATYPRIQIEKFSSPQARIIGMGTNFWEWYILPIEIIFWTKVGFIWNDGTTNLKDEELVKEYQEKIWDAIKDNFSSIQSQGFTRPSMNSKEAPELLTGNQFYIGRVIIGLWYFKQ